MNTDRPSTFRASRAARRARWPRRIVRLSLAAVALPPLLAACASTRPDAAGVPVSHDPYADLAAELAASAERRVDLYAMRVLVDGVHPRGAVPAERLYGSVGALGADPVGLELRHELEFALADRLYVVGASLAGVAGVEGGEGLGDRARRSGVTHALVAEYARHGSELVLSVRLVDVETLVVVATARGAVPEASLGDAARRRLKTTPMSARELPPRNTLVERRESPVEPLARADAGSSPSLDAGERAEQAAGEGGALAAEGLPAIEPIEHREFPAAAADDAPARPGPFELWSRVVRR